MDSEGEFVKAGDTKLNFGMFVGEAREKKNKRKKPK